MNELVHLNAKTGEFLVSKLEGDTEPCALKQDDISGFNPLSNKLYCVNMSNGMANLIEIDTHSLTSRIVNSFAALSTSSGVRLSHDGSEVAFTVYESDDCCLYPTTLFVSTENFQPSREKQMNQRINQVLGNGFDVNLDELTSTLYIGNDGKYIESSSNVITANYASAARSKGTLVGVIVIDHELR